MERPYIICHILSALDGKITGAFMGTPAYRAYLRERGISYILAGSEMLDSKIAAEKLY